VIPPNAVVVQGQRRVGQQDAAVASATRTVPVIVQYREPERAALAVLKDVMR
jgi:hypothetical protein